MAPSPVPDLEALWLSMEQVEPHLIFPSRASGGATVSGKIPVHPVPQNSNQILVRHPPQPVNTHLLPDPSPELEAQSSSFFVFHNSF